MVLGNKKGSGSLDSITIFIFIFIVLVVSGICIFLYGSINDAFQESNIIPTEVKESTTDYNSSLVNVLDGGIIFWLSILWIASIVFAFMLDNHPVAYAIFFIVGIISFFILVPLSIFIEDLQNSLLGVAFAQMPMTLFIFDHILLFIVAFLASNGVALYAKSKVIG